MLVCCLILAGCGDSSPSSNANEHAGHKPTMDVKLDVVGDQVTVTVTTDMTISPEHYGMARNAGEGHIHMYLDNDPKVAVKEDHMVFKDLPIGKHTLKVSLHNNDHTPYDVTQTFDFEIV
ncbi:hypothetical protein DFP95_11742 [Cohnella lupini]|uniref:DUF4399 domain-containing protein n=2 Tax=Cohnella lupini TaxID=1294267 RepID=A0A3D9I166_9BACL|nr:hypothetical protein DFP95_11742 [Cohnella lupini]